MWFEKYIIEKGKTDLLSSLKKLDKKIISEALKDNGVDSIEELKDWIIENFTDCLEFAKDDPYSKLYFGRLLENENSDFLSAYEDDVKALWVFVYEKKNVCSYYVADEIKKIIKKVLHLR